MSTPHHKTHQAGFSLVEIGIVIGIMSILSTALVPGLVAKARTKYGQQMVTDIERLHNAAKSFYHQEDRWPGSNESCEQDTTTTPGAELVAMGFIANIQRDPFSQQPYSLSVKEKLGRCHLRIQTPRNNKLSSVLPKVHASLKLFREPSCDRQNELFACAFDFETPSLADNFSERVEDTVAEKIATFAKDLSDKVAQEDEEAEETTNKPDLPSYIIKFQRNRDGQNNHRVCAEGYRASACAYYAWSGSYRFDSNTKKYRPPTSKMRMQGERSCHCAYGLECWLTCEKE